MHALDMCQNHRMEKERLRAECNALCKAQDRSDPEWMSVSEQNKRKQSKMGAGWDFDPTTSCIEEQSADQLA